MWIDVWLKELLFEGRLESDFDIADQGTILMRLAGNSVHARGPHRLTSLQDFPNRSTTGCGVGGDCSRCTISKANLVYHHVKS